MARTQKLMGTGASAAFANYITGDVASGLTATGNSQATALLLSADVNEITTTAASTGVRFPDATVCSPGDSIVVFNGGANSLSVYPATGESINGLSANASFAVAANARTICYKVSTTRWACT